MRKLILLIVPILFLLAACNNETKTDAGASETKKDSTATAPPVTKKDTSNTGTGGSPAQVFVDATGVPISGTTVTASDGKNSIVSDTSDVHGNYTFKTPLVKSTQYTFTPKKTGYTGAVQSATYDGTNSSLPPVPMTKQ
ncbi:MAG: hypothetical protein JWO03_2405 [Bacteroidetes bacterium]|nr:hypothetical protein [Bacteroidota bacterium]